MGAVDEEQAHSVCPLCRKPIDPDAANAIYARQRLTVPSVGELPDQIEGRGAFFHASCPPELIGWVRRARASG